MVPIICLETLLTNYQYTPRRILEERRSNQLVFQHNLTLRDFRLPPWSSWELHSSGLLRSE